jgi:hypothetical protein
MPGRRCFRCGSNVLPLWETVTGAILCRRCLRDLPTDPEAAAVGPTAGVEGAGESKPNAAQRGGKP